MIDVSEIKLVEELIEEVQPEKYAWFRGLPNGSFIVISGRKHDGKYVPVEQKVVHEDDA